MNGEQTDSRTQQAKGLISHTQTGGRHIDLHPLLLITCSMHVLAHVNSVDWMHNWMLSVKVLQHGRVAMSQVCFTIDTLLCTRTMFSMLVFVCRDPGDTTRKVSCSVEPSKCFKNCDFDAIMVFAPCTPLKMKITK